jgi:PKD repeat protein
MISYSSVGTYPVSLTVGDGVGTDTETKTGYITVKNVIAEFTSTSTSIVTGNTVTFTDNSLCEPTAWEWSFPGGTPSSFTGQTPSAIQYDVEGTYDVTLIVYKASDSDTLTLPGYITVLPPEFNMANGTVTTCMGNFYDSGGPTGNYSSNEDLTQTFYPSTPGEMVRFTFNSFDTESGYDFIYIYNGENTSASLIGSYSGTTSPGTVTASNGSGALTFNFTSDGIVTGAGWSASISCYSATDPPIAEFSASSTSPVLNTDVLFTDLSMNIPTSWSWSFSPSTVVYVNGTDASSQNPEVQFTEAGLYTVTLTASNAYGSDAETKIDYISAIDCSVSSYPYVQNFDGYSLSVPDFACTADGTVPLAECWINASGDDIDWDVLTGATGSSDTGPTTDHTGGGNYLYTESSSCFNNTGYIISPVFDLTVITAPELRFWYHMYGATMGTLSVQVSTNGGTSWSGNIWSLSGDQGNAWQEAVISLSSYTNETDLIIRFTGLTGTSYTSDMAIDDFSISEGFLPGESCSNPQDLSILISPYSATTSGYASDYSFCSMGSSPDRIFFIDVPNGYTIEIWQSLNNFNSIHTMRYGGACPGNTEIACIDDDDYTPISWENLTGSTERVWFVIAGNGTDNGDFTLEWSLTPTSVPFCNGDIDIDGAGSANWNYPLSTYYHDARTTSIYLASEFDCAGGDITSMQYYVSTVPGQEMNTFTIRMKHIASDSYSSAAFETSGWTIVYQAIENISTIGWHTLNFTTPFNYNGIDNIEVDVCYNNDSYTTDGNIYYFDGGVNRSKYYRCDGCSFPTTDPLTWTNEANFSTNVPRVLFTFESEVILDLKAYLEGPFNGSTMEPTINDYLPLSQPFNMPIWNYTGTESVGAIPNTDVVDWVLIDVRDAASAASATSSTSIAKQAAFILNDGSIVDLDGMSNLRFAVSISQNMFVVVWHRNHLGIMANSAIPSSGGVYTYDFTTGVNQVFGGIDGHIEISFGIWGMIGGDGNHDGTVNINDKSPLWESQAGSQGYLDSDHNLDGEANNQDKDDIWVPNENKSSQVPD